MLGRVKTVKAVLSVAGYGFDIEYTYSVPKELEEQAKTGCRILVPFGKGNRRQIALITREYYKDEIDARVKPLISVIDSEPSVNDELMKIIFWLKDNTFCTYFEAFKTVIPPGMGIDFNQKYHLSGKAPNGNLTVAESDLFSEIQSCTSIKQIDELLEATGDLRKKAAIDGLVTKGILKEDMEFKRKVGDETIKMVRLSDTYLNGKITLKISEKQKKVIDLLEDCGCASIKEICYLSSITSSVISGMCKNGVLELYEQEVLRSVGGEIAKICEPEQIILSQVQTEAFDGLKLMLDEGRPQGSLLHGITGSGKTAIFIRLIDYTLKCGKTAIMLVPEISLTPQMVAKFQSYFGNAVAVIHSGLSLGQRLDEFKRIRSGDAKIVIGTRSAIFAPLENIGLIIMDEEGERTYKSEKSPRYHARDVAVQRCGNHNSLLLMASATPSVESYYFAKNGRYKLFELNERYSNAQLPEVAVIDMAKESAEGNDSLFSRELTEKIRETISRGEQAILLLNRRGFHTYITCPECHEPVVCPNCSIPVTYHKKNGQVMCHYCGYSRVLEKACECGCENLRATGTGTQRLEEELSRLFPDAKVLRMDADTTASRYSYEKKFADFANNEYNIMVGTQMIAKGLDFPNVTLVGVLSLDKALFSGDFRSYERTFSLITQVVGRSGRGEKAGYAYIQTFVPEHYVLNLAASQDYQGFFEQEEALRRMLIYPPFCDICVIGLSSLVENEVILASDKLVEIFRDEISKQSIKMPLRVLGPSKSAIGKINNRFRYRIIIKCRNTAAFRALISGLLIKASKDKAFSNISVYADINGDIGL